MPDRERKSAYKDIRIHSFHRARAHTHTHTHTHTRARARARAHTHTHTHTLQIHALLVMHWYQKTTDQYDKEKRWVFSFDLKEESEDECLTEREREFQSTGPMYWLKGSLPQGPSTHPRNTEDASIRGWYKGIKIQRYKGSVSVRCCAVNNTWFWLASLRRLKIN